MDARMNCWSILKTYLDNNLVSAIAKDDHAAESEAIDWLLKAKDEGKVDVSQRGGFAYGVAPPGRRTVNTEPLPSWLVTVTSPPIMRASLRVMAAAPQVGPEYLIIR